MRLVSFECDKCGERSEPGRDRRVVEVIHGIPVYAPPEYPEGWDLDGANELHLCPTCREG